MQGFGRVVEVDACHLVWPEHSFIVYKEVLLAREPLASTTASSSFQTLKINKNMEWEGTEALHW